MYVYQTYDLNLSKDYRQSYCYRKLYYTIPDKSDLRIQQHCGKVLLQLISRNIRDGWTLMYLSEFSEVVKGTQGVKLLKCQHQGFVWRRVHEVKMDQIIYACQSNMHHTIIYR